MNKLQEAYQNRMGTHIERVSDKLLTELALLLGCSEEQTQEYCMEVWKFFVSDPPDLEMILDAYKRINNKSAPPNWIAYSIIAPASVDLGTAERRRKKATHHQIENNNALQIEQAIPKDIRTRIFSSYGLDWSSILDRERVTPDRMEHCPHGIPKGQLCGICNEKEFRSMTGIE
jgi:hypothetical protein